MQRVFRISLLLYIFFFEIKILLGKVIFRKAFFETQKNLYKRVCVSFYLIYIHLCPMKCRKKFCLQRKEAFDLKFRSSKAHIFLNFFILYILSLEYEREMEKKMSPLFLFLGLYIFL